MIDFFVLFPLVQATNDKWTACRLWLQVVLSEITRNSGFHTRSIWRSYMYTLEKIKIRMMPV